MSRNEYRPDVDGLRAIAVLLVLVFHAGLPILQGGFVGVDVFFVVSGFLITGIVHRETVSGTFSYTAFYRRRILRLMPALGAVMLMTTVAAAAVLLPRDLVAFAKSAIAVGLSLANVFFWREHGGYFGGNAQEVPLLHTWSLAVEEQYYFIWPTMLLLGYTLLGRRRLIGTTALLFVASLVLSEWVARVTFSASYYLLPTRMFELMAGSLLALTWSTLPRLAPVVNHAASIAGLALIGWSSWTLSERDLFPGLNALYPTLGTSLLILSGRGTLGIVNRVLALRPFVVIGLTSYSLYLWHWPLIVMTRYVGIALTPVVSGVLMATAILAGWLSWRFVERPFRGGSTLSFGQSFRRLFLLPMGACAAAGILLIAFGGWPGRFDDRVVRMEDALHTRPDVERALCHASSRSASGTPLAACRLGDSEGTNGRALLIGDSHANHFTGFIDELARPVGIQVTDHTMDACPPLFGVAWGTGDYFAGVCKTRNDSTFAHIERRNYDFIVLAGDWPTRRGVDALLRLPSDSSATVDRAALFRDALRSTLERVRRSGAVPIFIKRFASTDKSPKCPIIQAVYRAALDCEIPRGRADWADAFLDTVLSDLRPDFPELIIIDPKNAACDSVRCVAALDDVPLYRDADHLNDLGARALGHAYLATVGNPFLPVRRTSR